MIVGIDLDNTVSDAPEVFAVLTEALVAKGHQVHVITFRDAADEQATLDELAEYGIAYTAVHLPGPDDGDPAKWKGRLAAELLLDVMFEDSPEVLAAMPSGIKRFWLADDGVFDLNICIEALRKSSP